MKHPINKLMSEKNITLADLGRLTELSRNAIRRGVLGEEITLATAEVIAGAFGVHYLDLFEFTGNANKMVKRDTPFKIPLPDIRPGVNTSGWRSVYGSHPDAQAAYAEALRLRYEN
jgi:transcriptional regulator with XRE-family HTH domain